jgi:hypothetical protein
MSELSKQIINQYRSFYLCLIEIEVSRLSFKMSNVFCPVPERELTSQQKTELAGIADGCRNVLNKLEETLGKYRELSSVPQSIGKSVKES